MPDAIDSGQVSGTQLKDAPGQGQEDEFDKDRAMATILKLREFEKEAKAKIKELEGIKAKLSEYEQKNMSESEKVAKAIKDRDDRLAELEAKAKTAEERAIGLQRQVKLAAIASILGAYDPADPNFVAAVAGIDPALPTADADIKAALEALQKVKPYLFKPASGRGLESFNPAGTPGQSAETDAQRAQRVLRQTHGAGKGWGPLG